MKTLLACLTIALFLPAVASAGDVTMIERDVPLGARTLQAVTPPIRFNMIGVRWQGSGAVLLRTRSATGWQPWQAADADSGPDVGTAESNPTWHDGSPDWVGTSTGVQYRTEGHVTRLRAYYLWSKVNGQPVRALSVAGSPTIVPRSQWQADESIVRAKPRYAPKLELALVHHTVNTNNYSRAEAPAIVRGIEVYHVQANGWNDIGYNFLIDRFGTIYEGRGGGITRNVIGAHSEGFNTGSVGVALIGNFSTVAPPAVMQASLVKLLAWRMNVGHLDPLSTVHFTSGGNPKYKAGTVVTLRAISGHRDTYPTECPGAAAYKLLPDIAEQVARTDLPKLYAPTVTGSPGGTIRFAGELSSALAWTITVTNAAGKTLATHTQTSSAIDWSWNSAPAGSGPFVWSIDGPAALLGDTGQIGKGKLTPPKVTAPPPTSTPAPAPAVLLAGLTAAPSVLTPTVGSSALETTVDFTLGAAATVVAQAVSLTNTSTAPFALLNAAVPAGANTFQWDVAALPDGRYSIEVTATPASGAPVTATVGLTIDRTLSAFGVSPTTISPNGDGTNDTASFTFTLSQSVPVQLTIQRGGATAATVFSGQLGPGPQTVVWDGTSAGVHVPDGQYTAVVTETDALGTISLLAPITIDTTPPTLTVVNAATLQFQVGEAATLTAVVNGQTITATAAAAGVVTIPWSGVAVTSFSVTARDAAGNTSAAVTGP